MTPASTTSTSTAKARVRVLKTASPNAPWRPAARPFLPIAISATSPRAYDMKPGGLGVIFLGSRAVPHRLAVGTDNLFPALLENRGRALRHRDVVERFGQL